MRAAARGAVRRLVRGGALTAGPVAIAESAAWARAVEVSMSEPMSGVMTDCPTGSVPRLAAKCRARALRRFERRQITATTRKCPNVSTCSQIALLIPSCEAGAFPLARKRLANFLLSRTSHSQGLGNCVVISSEENDGNEKGRTKRRPRRRTLASGVGRSEPSSKGGDFHAEAQQRRRLAAVCARFATTLIGLLGKELDT